MEEHAYTELHQLEQAHWWYQGTRSIYRALLRRHASSPCGRVLDLGCGTGGNLSLLSGWGPVTGLEPWRPGLMLQPSNAANLVQGTAETLPFRDDAFGLVAMLGVIEHVNDDVGMLREARRVCRPGGIILLLTSAFMFLWSQHDEANRHVRRYTARELREKAQGVGLQMCYSSYLNFFLFPVAASVRLFQRLSPRRGEPHLDMFPVPEPFNTALAGLLALEGRLMQWVRLPLGVSLVAVLER
jgi:SAM-dependent methyltransferase